MFVLDSPYFRIWSGIDLICYNRSPVSVKIFPNFVRQLSINNNSRMSLIVGEDIISRIESNMIGCNPRDSYPDIFFFIKIIIAVS